MPRTEWCWPRSTIIALPIIGAALGHIPTIGAQLNAVTANLQLGMAGAFATALAIFLYALVDGRRDGPHGRRRRRRQTAAAAR